MREQYDAFFSSKRERNFLRHKNVVYKGWKLVFAAILLFILCSIIFETLAINPDIQVYFWVVANAILVCGVCILCCVPTDEYNLERQIRLFPKQSDRILLCLCLLISVYGAYSALLPPYLGITQLATCVWILRSVSMVYKCLGLGASNMFLTIKLNMVLMWTFVPITISLLLLACFPRNVVEYMLYSDSRLLSIILTEHAETIAIRSLAALVSATFCIFLGVAAISFNNMDENDYNIETTSAKALYLTIVCILLCIGFIQIELGTFKYQYSEYFVYDDWYTSYAM
jgi:hypothetical protein